MIVTLWKCRLCGAFDVGDATHPTPIAEVDARIAAPTKAARITRHLCGPNGPIGVADLVGATNVTDVTREID